MASDRKICVGMIAGAHGVRGLVRLRSFTEEPEAVASYGDLSDESGERKFSLELKSAAKDHFVVFINGITTKEDAEELRGIKLYAARAKLPKTRKQEYYAADLLGLAAQNKEGEEFGTVMAVHDHGAGTFLEIGKTKKDSFMLPFTDAFVPEVDVKSGHVVIEPPRGWP
jgi:16S rRNA processing protein RimM